MAQNLIINGVTYNGVTSLSIPTNNGKTATFLDSSNFETWTFELENGATVQKVVNVSA